MPLPRRLHGVHRRQCRGPGGGCVGARGCQGHWGQREQTHDLHVIDIAEPTRLGLFRMMQSSCPVDRDVGGARVELFRGGWA